MRRMLTFAGVLVFMTGILGVSGATANHKPPKQPGSVTVTVGTNTVTVRFGQHQGRPAKPFYGTLSLQLRALGLDPTRRVCGVVRYSGGVSGTNTICSDLSRWIWAKRGNFLTASLRITSPLPARCRLPAPHTPPHLTQRVNLTFWLDCRPTKPTKPTKPKTPVVVPVPTPVAVNVFLHLICSPVGTQVGVVVNVNGVPKPVQVLVCSTPAFIGSFPPGTVLTLCIQFPVGSSFLGNGPCISIRIDGVSVQLDLGVVFRTVVTTTTTVVITTPTTTTTTTTGGGPVDPNP